MEIFPKDSLPAPEGWERRMKTGSTGKKKKRTREKDIRRNGQNKAGRRKKERKKATVRIMGRNRGQS